MNTTNSVAILIPIFNRKPNLERCLPALLKSSYKNFRIVIIDDGSTDGSADLIRAKFPECVLLQGDGNLWWAGSINKGIHFAVTEGFDYILTYNDDQVCAQDFLEKLMEQANHKRILSSLVLYQHQPERILSSGILFDTATAQTRGYLNEQSVERLDREPYAVDASPGYSLLVPVDALKAFGTFDEVNFPQINMELEFCLRMKRNGIAIFVVPESKVWNDRSDKGLDPIQYINPVKRARWFATNIKSDLSFRQAQHLQRTLSNYSTANRMVLGTRHWFRYFVKLTLKALFPKQTRRRLAGLVQHNKDFWA